MKVLSILLVCLLFSGPFAYSQKSFTGYFINQQNDSIAVSFPTYNQWKNNPEKVKVIKQDKTSMELTADNCKSFTITGYDTYESKSFDRSVNSMDLNMATGLDENKDTVIRMHAFLLVLTDANGYKLYKYSDNVRENFFLESSNGVMTELKSKIYAANTSNSYVTDETYKRQLQVIFKDQLSRDSKLQRTLDYLAFNEGDLIRFIEATGSKKNTATNRKRFSSNFIILGGMAYNTFQVTGSNQSSISSSTSPVVAIGFITHQQRNLGRIFFNPLLKYYQFKNTGTYTNFSDKEDITYQAQVVGLYLGVGRNWIQTPGFTWYTTIAPNTLLLFNNTETYHSSGKVTKGRGFLGNVSLQTGISIKTGIGLWLHYNLLPIDVQNYAFYSTLHRSIQAGLSWQFH